MVPLTPSTRNDPVLEKSQTFVAPPLRQKDGTIDPNDIVPAQQLFRAIEKLGVASSSCLERELLHSVGRIRRRVSQNIQHLLLPGDLKETRVFRGVELYISGIAFIRHASLVFDVQLQALTGGGNEYPVLRIQNRAGAGGGALHGMGRGPQVDTEGTWCVRGVFRQPGNNELGVRARGVLYRSDQVDQTIRSFADRLSIGTVDRHAVDENRS